MRPPGANPRSRHPPAILRPVTRRLIFLTCAVLLLESFFSAVLTPMVPAFRQELGLSEGATGLLVAAYAAGSLIFSLPAGWFASRYNPRTAVVVGLLGVGVSSVAFGWAGHVAMLEASRFFLGAFGALMWAGGMSWTISAAGVAGRGQVMGTLLAAAVAGELIGSPVGAVADHVGTEVVFTGLLVLTILLAWLARTVPPVAEAAGQTAREALSAARESGVARWAFALVAVLGPSVALGSILVVVPLRVEALGLSSWVLAAGFLGMSLVEMVVGPLAGRWSDRVGRKTPFLVGLSIMAPCVVVVAIVPAFAGIAAVLAVYAVGSAFAFTTSMTWMADLATRAGLNQGYSSATSNIGWAGGLIVGAVVGGAIVGRAGFLAGGLAVAALLGVVGVVTQRVALGDRNVGAVT